MITAATAARTAIWPLLSMGALSLLKILSSLRVFMAGSNGENGHLARPGQGLLGLLINLLVAEKSGFQLSDTSGMVGLQEFADRMTTPDKIGEVPKSGGRLKFFTGKHWVVTQAEPETGKVIFHHGGIYTLDGNNYAETIEYANENTADLIKKTFKFKIKVEGDTYTQIGIDNPFSEVWKRAN